MQVHLLELVVVAARTHAAPIRGSGQFLRRQVDDKLLVFHNEFVRVAFLADGDIAHGRVGTDGARPADGDDIVVFLAIAASDHHGGQGINQGSGFEGDFHSLIYVIAKKATCTL